MTRPPSRTARPRRPAPGRLPPAAWPPSLTLALALALAASLAHADGTGAPTASPPAPGTRVHVRGSARIDARSSRAAGKLVLLGTLTDDSGTPLSDQKVAIGLASADDPTLPSQPFLLSGSAPLACTAAGDAAAPALPLEGSVAMAPTDAGGRFCLQVSVPIGRYVAHFGWHGSPWLDGTQTDLPLDLGRRPLLLSFAPTPDVIRLDDSISVTAVAKIDDDGPPGAATGLKLTLSDERGTRLGGTTTDDDGRATFAVDGAKMGPPGKGELRVAFDGSSDLGKSQHDAPVERRARVLLSAPETRGGALPSEDSDEGATFTVLARTQAGAPVPTGSVEALVDSAVVGAATIEAGSAKLVVNVALPAGEGSVILRLRYAPDAPWYTPGDELSLTLPVVAPSPLRRLPLLFAGFAVIAWLVLGRARRTSTAPSPIDDENTIPESKGEARIDVLRSTRSARAGWSGRVVDAHDGTPIEGAAVTLERPSFRGVVTAGTTSTNAAGRFELRVDQAAEGDALSVEAPLHASLKKPVPPFGELQIALVLRRRKLLDALVAWARVRGRPYDQSPEPTPGHVKRAAGPDGGVARWAGAVEEAAFGPQDVDAAAENAVRQLEPLPAQRPPPHPPRRDPR